MDIELCKTLFVVVDEIISSESLIKRNLELLLLTMLLLNRLMMMVMLVMMMTTITSMEKHFLQVKNSLRTKAVLRKFI
jgi:hypothetical protein